MKNVVILGGSGFVGGYIVEQLIECGYSVKMINRNAIAIKDSDRCSQVIIDPNSKELYKELDGYDCVIYNIGIIREFPKKGITFENAHYDLAKHTIDMAKKAQVRKFILMTANGVERCLTAYERTKFKAEEYLKDSKLEWTIFRPSVIFGDPNGKMEFCTQVKRDMVKMPLPLPIFFSGLNMFDAGKFEMSPIHVKNVAQFFVKAIEDDTSNKKIYELGGTSSLSWRHMLSVIADACNKRKLSIPTPFLFVKFFALLFDRFSWFPVTRDQLVMLSHGNTCDSREYFSDFDINEIPFEVHNLRYLS